MYTTWICQILGAAIPTFTLGNIPKRHRRLTALVALVLGFNLPVTTVSAQPVEATLANGRTVTAEFVAGDTGRQAVVLVHGLLQTRNYLTVNSLTNSLADFGFTVLAPTLSLGISHRDKSLACEAIHTHTMEDDVGEIAFWVNWLEAKGYSNIVLVGHSYGSLQNLVYAAQRPSKSVKRIVATSLVDVEHVVGSAEIQRQIEFARQRMKNNPQSLDEYKISYCKKYIAPPHAYLSYAEWTKSRILDNLVEIRIPVEVILGGNDTRMGIDWPDLVKRSGAKLTIIPDANHFFDAEYEFDLYERVQASILSASAQPAK
jgi:pimeloyl-ACP methyl ester carboxylesterase